MYRISHYVVKLGNTPISLFYLSFFHSSIWLLSNPLYRVQAILDFSCKPFNINTRQGMTKLEILICGGGIAGNALAFSLSKSGHDVTVIERFPSLRSTGLQVDLRGHGIEVLKRMGLEAAFRAKSIEEQGIHLVNSAGKVKAFFPANRTGKGLQSFTSDFEIMRGDFVRLLYAAAKDRVKYLFGTTVEKLEQHDDFVEISFRDGKKDKFDLVIGADGQGSHTRKMMLGPGAKDPIHFLGDYTGYFTMPRQIQAGEAYVATTYLAPGSRFLFTRRHSPHEVQVYLTCRPSATAKLRTARRGDVEAEKAGFAEIFKGAGWRSEEILAALEHAQDFYCERPGVVKLEPWFRGRVVLVGDAAYCPTQNTGIGTTSSFVGAYVLAGEIGRHCPAASAGGASKGELAAALVSYDKIFRPFMDQVQRGISEDQGMFNSVLSTALGIALANFFMGVAAFLKVDLLGRFVLRENVKDWSLPEYSEIGDGRA